MAANMDWFVKALFEVQREFMYVKLRMLTVMTRVLPGVWRAKPIYPS